jgi:hypothetical protein
VRAPLLLPLLAAAALAGCATTPGDPLVYLVLAGSGPCTVEVDAQRFTLPGDAAPLAQQLSRAAKRAEGALVDSGEEPLSYACYREAMTIVRRAGFPRLGLITAAPPDPNPQPEQPAPAQPEESGERPS